MDKQYRTITVRLEKELYDVLLRHSRDKYRSISSIVREFVVSLKKANKIK